MLDIIKSIIWIAGIVVVAYFAMGYFGYEVNSEYFTFSKKKCEEKMSQCANEFLRKGLDNARCDLKCVDPELIIKKK
jgi:hypothetical protein